MTGLSAQDTAKVLLRLIERQAGVTAEKASLDRMVEVQRSQVMAAMAEQGVTRLEVDGVVFEVGTQRILIARRERSSLVIEASRDEPYLFIRSIAAERVA